MSTEYPDPKQEPTEADPAAGERLLVGAILRQAMLDLRSPKDHVRWEAEAFLRDTETVRAWVEIVGADPDVVLRALESGRKPLYHHPH